MRDRTNKRNRDEGAVARASLTFYIFVLLFIRARVCVCVDVFFCAEPSDANNLDAAQNRGFYEAYRGGNGMTEGKRAMSYSATYTRKSERLVCMCVCMYHVYARTYIRMYVCTRTCALLSARLRLARKEEPFVAPREILNEIRERGIFPRLF